MFLNRKDYRMNLLKKLYQKKLHLWLLLSLSSQVYAQPETISDVNTSVTAQTSTVMNASQEEDALYAELHGDLIMQLNMIENAFDAIGQVQANMNNFHKKTDGEVADFIFLELRKGVAAFKEDNSLYINREQVINMAHFVARITSALDAIATKGLEAFVSNAKNFKPKKHSVEISIDNIKTIAVNDVAKLVQELEKDLKTIVKKSDEMGLSTTNKVYRSIRKTWVQHGLSTVAEKTLVYTGIFGWFIFITSRSSLENLPGSSVTTFLKDKLFGAEAGKTDPKQIAAPGYEAERTTIEIITLDKNGKFLRVQTSEEKNWKGKQVEVKNTKKTQFVDEESGKLIGESAKQKLESTTEDFTKFNDGTVKGTAVEVEITTPKGQAPNLGGDTPINLALAYLNKLFTLEGGAFFKIPVSLLAANYIKNDAIAIGKKLVVLKDMVDDKLRGAIKQRSWTEIMVGTDRFKDVVGRQDIKAELQKVINYVCSPEKFDRRCITPEKGYLFTGPSQNGKSAMIRAFANELTDALEREGKPNQVRLIQIPIKDIIAQNGLSSFVGMAEQFGQPVILAIDEFDMLSVQRDRDSKMLADVLTAMSSGLSASEKNMVMIIGLTNRPQNLDFALLQHGRFGKQFKFDKPTYQDRVDFFVKECGRRMMDANRFDIAKLAQETEGVSFGTLLAITKRAFLLAQEAGVGVTQAHFERALDTEAKNIIFTSQELPLAKQEIIAMHCAGKALTSYLLQPSKKLCKVTILPCVQEIHEEHVNQSFNWDKTPVFKVKEQNLIRYGNIFAYGQEDSLDMEIHEELVKECKVLVAGNVAQKVSGLKAHSFDKSDTEQAYALARKITFEGLEALHGMPKKASEEMLTQAVELLKTYQADVAKLLLQHKKALTALSEELLNKKILTGAEVAAIVEANK